MPVASIYRSTHLEMQLLSLPPRLEPGFVTHFSKHFLPTVCKINSNRMVSGNLNFTPTFSRFSYLPVLHQQFFKNLHEAKANR